MPIHVYERFKTSTNKETKGDKWHTIDWDFAAPDCTTDAKSTWTLKCDFRLPHRGLLYIPHPTRDSEAMEFEYCTPELAIPHYIPGAIRDKSFTPELKISWEALPPTCILRLGDRVEVWCNKEIVDAMEHSIDGFLYLYRPTELHVTHRI